MFWDCWYVSAAGMLGLHYLLAVLVKNVRLELVGASSYCAAAQLLSCSEAAAGQCCADGSCACMALPTGRSEPAVKDCVTY